MIGQKKITLTSLLAAAIGTSLDVDGLKLNHMLGPRLSQLRAKPDMSGYPMGSFKVAIERGARHANSAYPQSSPLAHAASFAKEPFADEQLRRVVDSRADGPLQEAASYATTSASPRSRYPKHALTRAAAMQHSRRATEPLSMPIAKSRQATSLRDSKRVVTQSQSPRTADKQVVEIKMAVPGHKEYLKERISMAREEIILANARMKGINPKVVFTYSRPQSAGEKTWLEKEFERRVEMRQANLAEKTGVPQLVKFVEY